MTYSGGDRPAREITEEMTREGVRALRSSLDEELSTVSEWTLERVVGEVFRSMDKGSGLSGSGS